VAANSRVRTLLTLFPVALLTACHPGDRDQHVVRDSAGITIIEISAHSDHGDTVLAIGSAPLLRIGSQNGDSLYDLHRVAGARRLSDGRIAVADGATAQLRVFGGDGRFLRAIGRRGRGPGEFDRLDWLQVVAGDTLVTLDRNLRRLTVFSPTGTVARTIDLLKANATPWPGDVLLPDGGMVVVLDTDDVWTRIRAGQLKPGQVGRSTAVLIRYDAHGAVLDTIATVPGNESAIIEGPAATYPPWGRLLSYAVFDGKLYVGTQETFSIRVYNPGGGQHTVIRLIDGEPGKTEDHIDRFMAAILERARSAEDSQALSQRFRSLPHPETIPAYGRILTDPTGRLWISEAHSPITTPVRWKVVDVDDGSVFNVAVPARFHVHEIGRDYVLGRRLDDDDTEYIEMYRLSTALRAAR
jgi:hypothetical protein